MYVIIVYIEKLGRHIRMVYTNTQCKLYECYMLISSVSSFYLYEISHVQYRFIMYCPEQKSANNYYIKKNERKHNETNTQTIFISRNSRFKPEPIMV